jgi:nitrogen regulatory protein P-II 1
VKKVEAIIRAHRVEEVKELLREVGVSGMTVTEIRGFGRTGGRTEVYRGSTYAVEFVPKAHIEVVVGDAMVAEVVRAIESGGRTGKIGDGKIFIVPVEAAWRIRTGETGEEAI